jgi:hypothetical protein
MRGLKDAGLQNIKIKFFRAHSGHEVIYLSNTGEVSKLK